jgi:hypothetical protein
VSKSATTDGVCPKDAARTEADRMLPYYSISDLAERWRCSRGTVYNVIRGERVLDFAATGHRGKKLIPAETVRSIEQRKMQVFR